jgi:threonine dehydrogenase-like Zn-dependent dehydrogenase
VGANFKAFEYTSQDSFIETVYQFAGDVSTGWTISRNGRKHLVLGPGYRLLRTMYCGICSTDLDRRHLPFSLPQVIGHEAVAVDPASGHDYVIEINDTCIARGDSTPEIFCACGLPTHCPGRMVLGIDRLPGGFGPWILAPINACVPVKGVALRSATLAEPFAAALHAVAVSSPRAGDTVAVVGPGRLGLLTIAALSLRRKTSGNFTITAVGRSEKNLKTARALGADSTIKAPTSHDCDTGQFDLVFDTSGTAEGLETSLKIARREIHLKSTNGQSVYGIRNLTGMVVDEISLLPFHDDSFDFHWEDENRENKWIYISPGIVIHDLPDRFSTHQGDSSSAEALLHGDEFRGSLPRFDMAIASSADEIDSCIRPATHHEQSLIRPRGGIIFRGEPDNNPLLSFIAAGGRLRTSRCGDLKQAILLLSQNTEVAALLEKHIITHEFPASRLPEAFEMAKKGPSIKVIIRHD